MKKLLPDSLKKSIKIKLNTIQSIGKTKYFCIGRNKTGTTSVKKAFEEFGFIVGEQDIAEHLHDEFFFKKKYKPIIDYCKTAQVFQDVPFSHFEILKELDKAYPNSKYILTLRDSSEQWYQSITKYHAKRHGLNGRIPTYEDILKCGYRKKGFLKRLTIDAHGTTKEDPYNKEILIAHYEKHNALIIDYFKDRPEDLLIINIADKNSFRSFIDFIGVKSSKDEFPWENKT